MKQTLITITIIALLIISGCATQNTIPTENIAEKTPIKIGWIGPLSGPSALYGQVELNGAKISADRINAQGGVNGRNVTLVIEDGKCDATTAVTAAKKLIEVENVDYMMTGCSVESMAVLPLTEQSKMFLIAMAGADSFRGAGKYAFRVVAPLSLRYPKLAKFAYSRGARKLAVITDGKEWATSNANNFKQSFLSAADR